MIKLGRIKTLYTKYESYLSPIALLAGFVFDSLTLRSLELWAENLVILLYLGLAFLTISFLSAYEAGRIRHRFLGKATEYVPVFLQFVFGGLFSAFLVFYSRSASVFVSWPFLLFLLSLLVGNELFRRLYQRYVFRLLLFYAALFSYAGLIVPIVMNDIGAGTFLISGMAGILVFAILAALLSSFSRQLILNGWKFLFIGTLVIYSTFNLFYFANLIPPIPLSLRDIGVYHSLKRVNGNYELEYEKAGKFKIWQKESSVFRWRAGEAVYVFSSVFAPVDLNTRILHRWSFYDQAENAWQEKSILGFPMTGGRKDGYRGYSLKRAIEPGKWRVDVMTEREQVIGRIEFEVVEATELPVFEKIIK